MYAPSKHSVISSWRWILEIVETCVVIVAFILSIVAVATVRTASTIKMPLSILTDNTAVINPPGSLCISSVPRLCNGAPASSIYIPVDPIRLYGNFTVKLTAPPQPLLVITDASTNTPLVFISTSPTGILVGPDASLFAPNTTTVTPLQLSTPVLVTPMWVATTSLTTTTTIMNDVCHVDIPTLCGFLIRTSPSDPGVFRARSYPFKTLFNTMPTGWILSDTLSSILVGGDVTIKTLTNLGTAVPCKPAPSSSVRPPSLAPGTVYISYTPTPGDTCASYYTVYQHRLPLNVCTASRTMPNVQYLSTAPFFLASLASSSLVLSTFSDPLCSASTTPTPTTYTLGCTPPNQYSFIYAR